MSQSPVSCLTLTPQLIISHIHARLGMIDAVVRLPEIKPGETSRRFAHGRKFSHGSGQDVCIGPEKRGGAEVPCQASQTLSCQGRLSTCICSLTCTYTCIYRQRH